MSIVSVLKILFWILVVSGIVYHFTKSVKRLFQVAGGLALYEAYNNLFDVALWPVIQGLFGICGAVGLTVTALILNFIMLKWYQRLKIDWLGITIVDEILRKCEEFIQGYVVSSIWRKIKLALPAICVWILMKALTNQLISFSLLSIFGDSFIATAYFLHRKNGTVTIALKKEDYMVFFISTIFSCVIWTLVTEYAILPAFKNVWQTFIG